MILLEKWSDNYIQYLLDVYVSVGEIDRYFVVLLNEKLRRNEIE